MFQAKRYRLRCQLDNHSSNATRLYYHSLADLSIVKRARDVLPMWHFRSQHSKERWDQGLQDSYIYIKKEFSSNLYSVHRMPHPRSWTARCRIPKLILKVFCQDFRYDQVNERDQNEPYITYLLYWSCWVTGELHSVGNQVVWRIHNQQRPPSKPSSEWSTQRSSESKIIKIQTNNSLRRWASRSLANEVTKALNDAWETRKKSLDWHTCLSCRSKEGHLEASMIHCRESPGDYHTTWTWVGEV